MSGYREAIALMAEVAGLLKMNASTPIARLCLLFISEAEKGLLQTFDETQLLLTRGHVAPPFLCLRPVLTATVEIGRTGTANDL
jgi:hypothetical protein